MSKAHPDSTIIYFAQRRMVTHPTVLLLEFLSQFEFQVL